VSNLDCRSRPHVAAHAADEAEAPPDLLHRITRPVHRRRPVVHRRRRSGASRGS
jgi:hypothetical protein